MSRAKTSSYGRPWVLLEQPKPEQVADCYAFWGDPPPVESERCRYWMRQIERGWRPNRRLRAEGYACSAHWYGVYIWEYLNRIAPALETEAA